jgi:hypothetical protein
MAQNLEYGVRITADGSVLVAEAGKSEQALKRIGTEAEKSTAAASKFGLAVGAAAAAGALAFGNLLKQTINTAAAFDDLAESTGSTVESLSSLANSMAISGVDFGTFQTLTNKLAVGLSGVDDEGGKAAKALAALGIQSKDPATAMRELALSLDKYADGANKAALLTAIFGRGAAQYAGALKDLAQDTAQAATVTTDFAAEAEKLQKEMARAKIEVDALAVTIAGPLTTAVSEFLRMTREGGWSGFWAWMGLTPADNADPDKALAETEAKIARIKDEIAELSKDTLTNKINNFLWSDVENLERTLAVAEARAATLRTIAQGITSAIAAATGSGGSKPDAPKPPGGAGKDAKVATADYTAEILKLNNALNATSGDGFKHLDAAYEKIVADFAAGKVQTLAQVVELTNVAKALDVQEAAIKKAAAATDEYVKEAEKAQTQEKAWADAAVAATLAINDQNKALELEHATLGMTDNQRAIYITNLKLAQAVTDGNSYAVELLTRQLELLNQQAADQSMVQYAENWRTTAASIRDELTDAFMNAAASGRDFFKSLASSLVSMFSNLVLRPIIQGVMAPIAGGITSMLYGGGANAAGSAAGSAGSSMFGNALSGVFSGGLSSFSGGFGGAITNVMTEGLFAGTATNFAGITGSLGAGNVMGALGLAAPYLMAAVGIGLAVKSILDSKKGGPKTGGFATAGSVGALTGTDSSGRWFTPSSADSAMQDVTKSVLGAYTATLASLGGKGSAGFALGYDTDPQGSAPNRLHAGAFVNGTQVYNAALGDLGRDDAALQAALETESKRALLAALQASDLPDQIAAVFNSVSASGATAEQIDNLIAFGSAMNVVIEAISGDVVADAQAAWESSQRTTVQVLADMGAEVIRLAGAMDGSVSSMQDLAAATSDYRNAVAQTLVAIRNIQQAVAAMFSATGQSIQLFGKNPTQLYDFYMGDAASASALLANEHDPVRAQNLANRIDADINAAFNALPDGQKGVMQPILLEYLFGADGQGGIAGFAQQQLDRIFGETADSTADPFAAANAALNGAAGTFNTAAGKVDSGASKFDAAVDKFVAALPLQVNVAVQTSPAAEVGG